MGSLAALWRKDLYWVALFVVGWTLVLSVLAMELGFFRLWVYPGNWMAFAGFDVWFASGASLGLAAGVRETITRTEEYLRHRPLTVRELQVGLHAELLSHYPALAKTGEREVRLVRPDWEAERVREVDADHRVTGTVRYAGEAEMHPGQLDLLPLWYYATDHRRELPWPGRILRGGLHLPYDPVWLPVPGIVPRRQAFLHLRQGTLRVYTGPDPAAGTPARLEVVPPEEPCSLGEQIEPCLGRWGRPSLSIGDPETGDVWALRRGTPQRGLHRIELPGGDRYRSWHRVDRELEVSRTRADGDGGGDGDRDDDEVIEIDYVIVGEAAEYYWDGQALVEAPPEPDPGDDGHGGEDEDFHVVERAVDPLCLEVVVEDRSGKPYFSHRFGLRTAPERALGALLHAGSLARLPVLERRRAHRRPAPSSEPAPELLIRSA